MFNLANKLILQKKGVLKSTDDTQESSDVRRKNISKNDGQINE